MNAIILSAGSATRLGYLAKEIPKGLLEINGKTIIERQIEIYKKNGIEKIILIIGPHSNQYTFDNVIYVKDTEYEKHDVLGSLMTGSNYMDDEFIMSYSDIVFDEAIIDDIINFKGDVGIAVDYHWEKNYENRTLHPKEQADNVVIKENKILKIRKNISHCDSTELLGEFIGIMKLSKNGSKIFLEKYDSLKKTHKGKFHNADSFEQAYLTDILQDLINSGNIIQPINIQKAWCEIDTPEDIPRAKKILV